MNIDFRNLTVAELQALITCSQKELDYRVTEMEKNRIKGILLDAIEEAAKSPLSICFQDSKRTVTIEDLMEMSLYIE